MSAQTPRYEFRIFGADCLEIGVRIRREAALVREDEGQDVYILAAYAKEQNCKIRESHLEIKSLFEQEADLELWQPIFNAPFPIAAAWLQESLFPLLNAEQLDLQRQSYTSQHFLAEVVAEHPDLHAILVVKQRHHYRLNDCDVEISEINIADQLSMPTLALEAEQAAVVQETRTLLGLESYHNVNYVKMLTLFVTGMVE